MPIDSSSESFPKTLTLRCSLTRDHFKAIFKATLTLIENHLILHYHRNTNIQHFHPKKLLISTPNLRGLLYNPFLSNVRDIVFGDGYFFTITPLPSWITHVTFNNNYNTCFSINKLPDQITHLSLGWSFNQPISTSNLPNKLTFLKLGCCFNWPITSLPQTLTHFCLGSHFSQPLSSLCSLPPSTTHLEFAPNLFLPSLPVTIQQVTLQIMNTTTM
eukprot:TRINITY_DN3673_c0_g2_i1.p1 TRINITY_DN3673_c0_g2~~TRINITY_DN3673_c0_g2_i1.p1  ORF type:complete len:216 (+),score=35.23 TRINITY_DN3673_c0_g2_i1:435-1082(+)